MIVYLLTMYAIYDHGTGGIFTTEQAAIDHALELDAKSDGHHDWRIDAIEVDKPLGDDLTLTTWPRDTLGVGRRDAITINS